MRRAAVVLIAFLYLGLLGCDDTSHIIVDLPESSPDETILAATQATQPQPYTVLFETDPMPLAPYEPADGCYLSAAIPPPTAINVYEQRVGIRFAAYSQTMRLDEAFPYAFVLRCVARMKMPFIIIQPPKEAPVFDYDALSVCAEAFGAYRVPMLVAFYPDPSAVSADAEAYILYFRYARALFKKYAPEAAFVWVADVRQAQASIPYYPGDDVTDWVGLNIFEPLTQDGHDTDFMTDFDFFYDTFQADKPMMIAQLAISHFSAIDYRYQTREAAAELTRIYDTVRLEYPRVKLINYADCALNDFPDDVYTVSDNDELLEAFRLAVDDSHFLSDPQYAKDVMARRTIRSSFAAYAYQGRCYLAVNTLVYELALPGAVDTLWLDGVRCTDLDLYQWDNHYYVIKDHELHQIILKKLAAS